MDSPAQTQQGRPRVPQRGALRCPPSRCRGSSSNPTTTTTTERPLRTTPPNGAAPAAASPSCRCAHRHGEGRALSLVHVVRGMFLAVTRCHTYGKVLALDLAVVHGAADDFDGDGDRGHAPGAHRRRALLDMGAPNRCVSILGSQAPAAGRRNTRL
jgi:hypothetical protein